MIFICRLRLVVLLISLQWKYFFLFFFFFTPNLSSSGCSHVGSLLTNEEQKDLACDDYIFDIFATHAGLVYDVTDTDCWAQNGSTRGCVFATFKRRFLKIQTHKRFNRTLIYYDTDTQSANCVYVS